MLKGARKIAFLTPKLLLALLCGAWLVWSLFDDSSVAYRISKINSAIERGQIGRLGGDDEAFLRTIIPWLMRSADLKSTRWNLNGKVDRSELNFYTVSTEVSGLTYCDPGNAVYDAELNAVFLHEDLVKGITYVDDGSGNKFKVGWSDRKVYLSFVILHELGHRVLHGKTRALYDERIPTRKNSDSRRWEIEADSFAFSSITEAYRDDLSGSQSIIGQLRPAELQYIAAEHGRRAEPSRLKLGLDITSLIENWFESQIGSGSFSPYHFDSAHPNLAYRLRSLADAVDPNIYSERVREAVFRAKDAVDRIDAISQKLIGQVTFPFKLERMSFQGNTLWAVSSDGRWASVQVEPLLQSAGRSYQKIDAQLHSSVPPLPLPAPKKVQGMVADASGPWLAVDSDWKLYRRSDATWRYVQLSAPRKPDISLVYQSVYEVETPAGKEALIVSSDGGPMFDAVGLHFVRRDGAIVERTSESIAREIQGTLHLADPPTLLFGSINQEVACMAVFDRNELKLLRLRGAVVLDRNLQVSKVYSFPTVAQTARMTEATILCPREPYRLVAVGRDYTNPGYGVYDLALAGDQFDSITLRGRFLHLGERFNGRSYQQPSSSFFSAEIYGPGDILHVGIWGDGYFLVDRSGRAGVLFHPGDGVVAKSGSIVAISPGAGARHAYILSTANIVAQREGMN